MEPRLCLTVTTTFHDDPRLADLLQSHSTDSLEVDGQPPGRDGGTPDPDDEYLVESFDG